MAKRKYNPVCSFEGCEKPSRNHGLCIGHNTQRYKGKPLVPLRPKQIRPRGLPCEVCGGTDYEINNTRFCSERCKHLDRQFGGNVPVSYACGKCGETVMYTREGKKRRPLSARLCDRCNRRKQLSGFVQTLADRDGTDCQICLEPLDISKRGREDDSVSVDHIIPVSYGGTEELENLRLAHLGCNRKRSNTPEREVA